MICHCPACSLQTQQRQNATVRVLIKRFRLGETHGPGDEWWRARPRHTSCVLHECFIFQPSGPVAYHNTRTDACMTLMILQYVTLVLVPSFNPCRCRLSNPLICWESSGSLSMCLFVDLLIVSPVSPAYPKMSPRQSQSPSLCGIRRIFRTHRSFCSESHPVLQATTQGM